MFLRKCRTCHIQLSVVVVTVLVIFYLHIKHPVTKVRGMVQVTEMTQVTKMAQVAEMAQVAKTIPKKSAHKPILDDTLLNKYRASEGKSDEQSRELLKCAGVGKDVTAQKCLITYITAPGWVCPGDVIRVGPAEGDGGWSACVSPQRGFIKPCVVFSFGINNHWEFDDAMSNQHDCEVHSFDPSMKTSHHNRGKRIHFYDVGLGRADKLNFATRHFQGTFWPMLTFKSILSMLQLTNTPINMVKMDIEHGELSVLPPMAREGSLDNVAQLAFEIHLPENLLSNSPLSAYADLFIALEEANFALFYTRMNERAHRTRLYGNASYYEMHFFNKVLIETML